MPAQSDLATAVFLVLRTAFFGRGGEPVAYSLRDKQNTQDDPFDEFVHRILLERFPADVTALRAPGPLITPDLAVMRPDACAGVSRAILARDLGRVVAVEVKKLERTTGGGVARSSGLDYNTTPPCGTVRVYDGLGRPLDTRCFYLFVCQGKVAGQQGAYSLSSLVLCDGNLLNEDFQFYLAIVGARTKGIGLGTYGDGANRIRPMLIFANPLGVPQLDRRATLIHQRDDLHRDVEGLRRVGLIKRTVPQGGEREFYCYRVAIDVASGFQEFNLTDPFPTPLRSEQTQPRGRFRLNILPAEVDG